MSDLQRILDWITGQIPFLKNKIKSVEGNFDNYAKKSDIPSLDGKADKSAIPTKVSQLENDSGYLSAVPDVYAKKSDIPDISGKQDKIADLDTIRAGAAAGATAMQKLPDDVAKKADIPDTSNFVTSQDVTNQLNGIFGGLKITPWAEIDTTTAE